MDKCIKFALFAFLIFVVVMSIYFFFIEESSVKLSPIDYCIMFLFILIMGGFVFIYFLLFCDVVDNCLNRGGSRASR